MEFHKIKSTIYLGLFWVILAFPNFGVKAQALTNPDTLRYILTPEPSPKPKINGAKVYGIKPNSPLIYRIAATGNRPMTFSASNLPKGISLDRETGILTGKVTENVTYKITLQAKNSLGIAKRELRLVVGDEISLTPLMGCNTYGGWGPFVNEKNIRDAAKALVSTDLINHGYSYVNIDDGWQGTRGGKYNAIQPNEKFSDMKQLADDVHKLGLKLGIFYTSEIL
jgi:alpha-galactosidase